MCQCSVVVQYLSQGAQFRFKNAHKRVRSEQKLLSVQTFYGADVPLPILQIKSSNMVHHDIFHTQWCHQHTVGYGVMKIIFDFEIFYVLHHIFDISRQSSQITMSFSIIQLQKFIFKTVLFPSILLELKNQLRKIMIFDQHLLECRSMQVNDTYN